MSYGSDNPSDAMGAVPHTGGVTLNPEREMGFAASKMRRKAIANALRGSSAKHGLFHAPHIQHSKNGQRNGNPLQFNAHGAFRDGGF